MQDYSNELTAVLFGEDVAKRLKEVKKYNRQKKLKEYILAFSIILVMTIIIGIGFTLAFR